MALLLLLPLVVEVGETGAAEVVGMDELPSTVLLTETSAITSSFDVTDSTEDFLLTESPVVVLQNQVSSNKILGISR